MSGDRLNLNPLRTVQLLFRESPSYQFYEEVRCIVYGESTVTLYREGGEIITFPLQHVQRVKVMA